METAELIYFEDLKYIKEKTEKPYIKQKLKYTLFGGYNKKDVMELIDEISNFMISSRQDYYNKVKQIAGEIEELKNEKENLNIALDDTIEQKNISEKNADFLINENKLLKRKNINCTEEIYSLRIKNSELEQQIKAVSSDSGEYKKLKTKYDELSEMYKASVCSRENYLNENESLVRENSDLKKICSKLVSENEKINGDIFRLFKRLNEYGLTLHDDNLQHNSENNTLGGANELMGDIMSMIKALKPVSKDVRPSLGTK